jgi:3-methyladenine DNA glycosylase/8-oxoguanine DNA glycosylase
VTRRIDLDVVTPYAAAPALLTLATHAVPGAEVTDLAAGTHRRVVQAAAGPVATTVSLAPDRVSLTLDHAGTGDVAAVIAVVRRWLDLDGDPGEVRRALGDDPVLGPLLSAEPGLRVTGHPDGFEAAAVTVIGQQVSLAACRTFCGRLTAAFGTPGPGGLTVFPSAETLAGATPDELRQAVGVTNARARTLHSLAEACADGLDIHPDGDHDTIRSRLIALPGIGPWTVDYLAMRALNDRDAYPAHDLVLRRALGVSTPAAAAAAAGRWSPYRAYAVAHLWHSLT